MKDPEERERAAILKFQAGQPVLHENVHGGVVTKIGTLPDEDHELLCLFTLQIPASAVYIAAALIEENEPCGTILAIGGKTEISRLAEALETTAATLRRLLTPRSDLQ